MSRILLVHWNAAEAEERDLSQPAVRSHALERGWVDFKVCAIDATWSALCFSRRARSARRSGPSASNRGATP